jgi:hypothetical protein
MVVENNVVKMDVLRVPKAPLVNAWHMEAENVAANQDAQNMP